uniref:Uncharacterized protein n=1 Tax=uncultured Acidobacteria bacterium HF4000_26D02 TaxID=710731 RepID=E0XW81_9BACT|nr:hypothetical protein [uncultured Acidobacteria bacterium HF4000_26D02]
MVDGAYGPTCNRSIAWFDSITSTRQFRNRARSNGVTTPTSVANPIAPSGVSIWNATVAASASCDTSNGVNRNPQISVGVPHWRSRHDETLASLQTARVAAVACTGTPCRRENSAAPRVWSPWACVMTTAPMLAGDTAMLSSRRATSR